MSVAPKTPAKPPSGDIGKHRRLAAFAWLTMLVGFGVFCWLVYAAVTTISTILSTATEAQYGTVQATGADVHTRHGLNGNLIKVEPTDSLSPSTEEVTEGDMIQVGNGSTATVTLFETGNKTTIVIGENTQLVITAMHTSRYFNQRDRMINLQVSTNCKGCTVPKGSMSIMPVPGTSYKTNNVSVQTEYGALLDLSNISTPGHRYGIWLERNNDVGTTIFTSENNDNEPVVVRVNDQQKTLTHGLQLSVVQNELLPAPTQIGRDDLIKNGAFLDPLDGTWDSTSNQGGDQQDTTPGYHGNATDVTDDGSEFTSLHLHRLQGQTDAYETSVQQNIGYTIPDYIKSVMLNFTYKVNKQSVPGGGVSGYEFPLTIEVDYSTLNSGQQKWLYNVYVTAPAPGDGTIVLPNQDLYKAVPVVNQKWYELTNFDMMKLPLKPTRIDSIKIAARGHQYDSYITNIELKANNGG